MTSTAAATPTHGLRGVLAIPSFRTLWLAFGCSSLGDWLSVLALTSFASIVTADAGYAAQSFAVGGVLILKIAPALVLGPLAGALADRFDRRRTMVVVDVARAGLFVSIPLVGQLQWVFIATFLSECIALFWNPAKEAVIPNLVPRERLESANQLNLFATYGAAPLAAGLFALLSVLTDTLSGTVPFFSANPVDLALYGNAATFLVAAGTVYALRDIPWRDGGRQDGGQASLLGAVLRGLGFVGRTRVVRGLVLGILGGFAAAGAVIGVARVHLEALGGGNTAYGVLFGAVFLGLAGGMFTGPRILIRVGRHRLFGLAIVGVGVVLAPVALIRNLVLMVALTCGVGALAGIAWVIGYTLIGLEVDDAIRGRTFAVLQNLVKVDLLLVLAVVPFLAGAIGTHPVDLGGLGLRLDGSNVVLLLAALVAAAAGATAYHQMNGRRGPPAGGPAARVSGHGQAHRPR